jgi:hypothetical protein
MAETFSVRSVPRLYNEDHPKWRLGRKPERTLDSSSGHQGLKRNSEVRTPTPLGKDKGNGKATPVTGRGHP